MGVVFNQDKVVDERKFLKPRTPRRALIAGVTTG